MTIEHKMAKWDVQLFDLWLRISCLIRITENDIASAVDEAKVKRRVFGSVDYSLKNGALRQLFAGNYIRSSDRPGQVLGLLGALEKIVQRADGSPEDKAPLLGGIEGLRKQLEILPQNRCWDIPFTALASPTGSRSR